MINIATLKAMFRLYDGYSTTIDKVNKKTDHATNKILKASGSTDKFNKKLEQTGASAGKASGGLGKLISAAAALAVTIKGMNIADEFINTSARLSLINDGLQTQLELQDKIFAAANRSKGEYQGMASAISKMGLMAGESFGSNDELIAFTELIQKGFKVGGSSATEQSSAMLQLTQAMGSGKLQGDEFRSIMENAPLIAAAIAKYTGKSKGELKEMSSEGLITSDIIKNAMFGMSDEINAKFATMPMTFADVWNKIKNGGLKAFGPVMESINKLINTDGFQTGVNNAIVGINLLAGAMGWLIDISTQYWDFIGPVLAAIGGYLLVTIIGNLWAMVAPLLVQGALWAMLTSPIFLVILAIGLILVALNAVGVTTETVFGFIGGSIGVLLALFTNLGTVITNTFIAIAKIIESVIYGAINYVLSGINDIIAGLNKIPGVNIGSVGELKGFYKDMDYLKYANLSDAYTQGSNVGKNVYKGTSDKFAGVKDSFSGLGEFGTTNKPLVVAGTGSNGSIEVNMADEDLQYLRDIAEREYINKFSTATLAPNVTFNISDIKETADVNVLKRKLEMMISEEIATAAEGAY